MKKLIRMKRLWISAGLLLILISVFFFHAVKPLPDGISFEGGIYYTDDIQFLTDLTYQTAEGEIEYEQEIFEEVYRLIEEAEDFILVDMFLFNDYSDEDRHFPKLSTNLTEKIIAQKQRFPELQAVFITDPINTGYHSHANKNLQRLKDNGVEVIITSLSELRDSNPIYSTVWRTFFQVFGQRGSGWITNPLASEGPDVTLRSYLKLLNIKANHRKVVASENAALITSANAHDASGFFSNIAFKVEGDIIRDIVSAEQAVVDYSIDDIEPVNIRKPERREEDDTGAIAMQYLTEGEILKHTLKEIDSAEANDEIWLGMFYLAQREVIGALLNAADRGAEIRMILDPNVIAFGTQKTGLPNLPVASELYNKDNITVRWYDSEQDQFHTKLMFINKAEEGVLIGGSTNFTKRNLDDLNLENNLKVTAAMDEEIMRDVESYFYRIWENQDGIFTADYDAYQDQLTPIRKATYWIQKLVGFTTY
ncbi:phospholipase D family protein [Virgibacillus sp. C22-A2]|uniref:phospholipase D n=1 Tax=Virgibacillus tibetensis TaxID=3042313 RepID=A0ABU6KDX0_9BACI|nr:phospholipase D family protein [Virgibacillus sp. C22-A2]